jgi:hypothetical protein
MIRRIPLSDIDRIEIFVNSKKLTLSQIISDKQPDLVIQGCFYLGNWTAACHLKADGKIISNDSSYSSYGFAWDTGADIGSYLLPGGAGAEKKNYITCCSLIEGGVPKSKLYYNSDVGGKRGRGGMGIAGNEIGFIAFPDGSESMTPEALRDYAAARGFNEFVMMDGGGKVNFYDKASNTKIQGRDKSQNLILVYLKSSKCPYAEPTKAVKYGSFGTGVKWLQWHLNRFGFACGAVDGWFGAKTRAALLAFQKSAGLVQDGSCGPLTRATIRRKLNG